MIRRIGYIIDYDCKNDQEKQQFNTFKIKNIKNELSPLNKMKLISTKICLKQNYITFMRLSNFIQLKKKKSNFNSFLLYKKGIY
ncbi:unnamed protein product [Paramecium sonneborni]|uniref:Uncharacterized protein n=1 Tax=Paramecium sonneborni TaxID=65129 RepID=A0A8S1KY74_9CILI|nr:unnamed protein product [Paramecium sonneborni]